MTGPNLERRIRRHVLGKPHTFFAATAPGLEALCREEILALGLGNGEVTTTRGGVTFRGRIPDCYSANLKLRTANRVLMRIDTFRADNFRQLEKKAIDLPWELFVRDEAAVKFRVRTARSRLYHTDAVAEQLKRALARRWEAIGGAGGAQEGISPFPQQIFVRAVKDRFTVSLDSSGELLYKRGLKTQGGKAPLRETRAAAVLAMIGYGGDLPFLDPMCGSGTFSLEAAMIADRIPAGFYRKFGFMGWPAFRPAQWEYIRREAAKEVKKRIDPIILAADKVRETCDGLERIVRGYELSGTISVVRKDFFDLLPSDVPGAKAGEKPGLIAMNPPYGRRLGTRSSSVKLFSEICRKLKADFHGWKVALIAPKGPPYDQTPFPVKIRALFHGGLRLHLLTGEIV